MVERTKVDGVRRLWTRAGLVGPAASSFHASSLRTFRDAGFRKSFRMVRRLVAGVFAKAIPVPTGFRFLGY